MKSKKWILSLLTGLLFSVSSFAQQKSDVYEIEGISSEILSLISSLNDNIDNYFLSEKRKKLRRYLGYFQNDLRKYLTIRKKLMDNLTSNNYDVMNNNTKKIVSDLKSRLDKLSMRLLDISLLLHEELSDGAQDIVSRIHQAQQAQQALYLTELDKLIHGEYVDKEKLAKNGETIYAELSRSVKLISTIRDKLK